MTEAKKGVLAMVAACIVWGLSPLYYKELALVPPLEVLSHRTLWSLALFGLVLALQGRVAQAFRLLAGRSLPMVICAALAISANWFLFILSVQIGHTVEASLGYYIFPLVAVVLGVVAFGERLTRGQGIAVALAAVAVGVLTWGLGVTPWIALTLAGTFGAYGLIKKRLGAGPVVSVTAEVMVLAPVAVLWLWGVHGGHWAEARPGGVFGQNMQTSILLAFSGVLTAGPLILFSYATKRVDLTTIGLVQYLNPTLQFLCATLVFAEPFTRWHMVSFGLIWAALALYAGESLRQERAARRRAVSTSTLGTSTL